MENVNNPKELRYALLTATRYDVEHAKQCYDFIQGEDQPEAKPEPENKRPDGIYFVLSHPVVGRIYTEYRNELTDEQKARVIGIGVQYKGVSFRVGLHDYEDVVLLPDDEKAPKRPTQYERECDALQDFDSEGNTKRLIEDNPDLANILQEGEAIPALGVLNIMAYLRDTINQALEIVGGDKLGVEIYWSSTEYNQSNAWLVGFSYGITYYIFKYFGFAVRAVAAF